MDRQTDGQMDRITMTKTVQRIASHGKNCITTRKFTVKGYEQLMQQRILVRLTTLFLARQQLPLHFKECNCSFWICVQQHVYQKPVKDVIS